MALELTELASGLSIHQGIYRPQEEVSEDYSFPKTGSDNMFEVDNLSYWFQHRNRCIEHFVRKYSRDGVFLDVGGGNGIVSKRLQDAGFDPIVIEPHKAGCVNSLSRGVRNVFNGTLNDLNFSSKASIHSIGSFDVIEHIEDDLGTIKKMASVLSEGGFLYICVPASNFLWSKSDERAGHFRRYSRKSLGKIVENAGFKIIESNYFFSLRRVATSFWAIPGGKQVSLL